MQLEQGGGGARVPMRGVKRKGLATDLLSPKAGGGPAIPVFLLLLAPSQSPPQLEPFLGHCHAS